MDFQDVIRKPYVMKAIQVTLDNAEQIAEWCKGKVVMHHVKLAGADTKLPAVQLNRPSTGGKDYTTALIGFWVIENRGDFRIYKDSQYKHLFDPAGPVIKKWTPGLPVRVIKQNSNLVGYEGVVQDVDPTYIWTKLENGNIEAFFASELEILSKSQFSEEQINREAARAGKKVHSSPKNPIILIPGDHVFHTLGTTLCLQDRTVTQIPIDLPGELSGEGAPLPDAHDNPKLFGYPTPYGPGDKDLLAHSVAGKSVEFDKDGIPFAGGVLLPGNPKIHSVSLTPAGDGLGWVKEQTKSVSIEGGGIVPAKAVPKPDGSGWIISDEAAAEISAASFGKDEEPIMQPFPTLNQVNADRKVLGLDPVENKIDPFAEPPNPTPAGESLLFEVDDNVIVIDEEAEFYNMLGRVVVVGVEHPLTPDGVEVEFQMVGDSQKLVFHPTQLKRQEFQEYRCTMCGEIGGDTHIGEYKGCPKNVLDNDQGTLGKHDMKGDVV